MTLQISGVITVGDINVELGKARNAAFNIGSTEARTLAKIPSGIIKMSDFYGKSTYPVNGTYLSDFCLGYDYYKKYANGSGGTYDVFIEGNSIAHCGYPISQNYNYDSPGTFTVTIPGNVTSMSVSMVGGGGGGGGGDSGGSYIGSLGGEGAPLQVIINLSVTTTDKTFTIYVGAGGGAGISNRAGSGGGSGGAGYSKGGNDFFCW